jgi:hypothetical protein
MPLLLQTVPVEMKPYCAGEVAGDAALEAWLADESPRLTRSDILELAEDAWSRADLAPDDKEAYLAGFMDIFSGFMLEDKPLVQANWQYDLPAEENAMERE